MSFRTVALWAVALTLLLVPASTRAQFADCSTVSQNLFVRDLFNDLYYWYEHIPDVDAAQFGSPEEYLEAIRYRPLDRGFSRISSRAETEAFYSDSQFIGFGFSTRSELVIGGNAVQMHISQVFEASPAAAAGLQRGDMIVSIGGRAITNWWRAGELGIAFGPAEIGYETTVVYRHGGAEPVEVGLTKQLVTIPTVSTTRVYDVRGVKVGYIFFRNFVQPSMAALDEAFAQLRDAGVRELVLDLRYNGGGLVSVAQHLASLVGGARTEGLVLGEYAYNDKNTFRNRTLRFESPPHALTLDRLFVITSRSTASASELVINGLRPFLPVIVIGDRTLGKPVGQNRVDFCDKSAFPVTFTIPNANGEADYFDGIPATCSAADDLRYQIGDSAEASLAEALQFVDTGACSGLPGSALGRSLRPPLTMEETGFRQLIGAW
jgi:carboxyl-terminal processing protease